MKNLFRNAAVLGTAAFAVSGCLGSSDGSSAGNGLDLPPAGADFGLAEAAALAAAVQEDADFDGTEGPRIAALVGNVIAAEAAARPSDPLTGSASYSGDLTALNAQDASVIARLSLDADFADGSLSGEISDVLLDWDGPPDPLSGTLQVTGTVADNGLEADVAGGLSAQAGAQTVTADVSGRLTGEVVGADGAAVAGGTQLGLSGSNLPAMVSGEYTGIFHATRDD